MPIIKKCILAYLYSTLILNKYLLCNLNKIILNYHRLNYIVYLHIIISFLFEIGYFYLYFTKHIKRRVCSIILFFSFQLFLHVSIKTFTKCFARRYGVRICHKSRWGNSSSTIHCKICYSSILFPWRVW